MNNVKGKKGWVGKDLRKRLIKHFHHINSSQSDSPFNNIQLNAGFEEDDETNIRNLQIRELNPPNTSTFAHLSVTKTSGRVIS